MRRASVWVSWANSALDGAFTQREVQCAVGAFNIHPIEEQHVEVDKDTLSSAVVQDYIAWQAPYLLQLSTLDEAQRRALEIQAYRWPQRLMNMRRLLPAIVDKTLVDTTLARARLERG